MENQTVKSPKWWSANHTGVWDKLKEGMKQDWEQAKARPSDPKAMGSAVGKPQPDFSKVEPAYRYGVGLSTQYPSQKDWNPTFEGTLAGEWSELGTQQPWLDVKGDVQRGFERARRG
jgi:hypothetical protein